jgi:hypothetical protein
MRLSLAAAAAVLAIAVPAQAADDGDVIRAWNELAFQQVRSDSKAFDGQAARLYAMLNAAMFDAVNGTAAGGPPRHAALVTAPHPIVGDPAAAAAGAAHDVLAALYPGGVGTYDGQLASDLAGVHLRPSTNGRGLYRLPTGKGRE